MHYVPINPSISNNKYNLIASRDLSILTAVRSSNLKPDGGGISTGIQSVDDEYSTSLIG